MTKTAREHLREQWDQIFKDGIWAASWSKSLDGLTAAQAAWTPGPGRHSVWQHVLHMVFWRQVSLERCRTGAQPSDEDVKARNFPDIPAVTDAAWADARRRFQDSQDQVSAALAGPDPVYDRLAPLIPHDAYHFGQINLLRAMQGFPPIE
ncbi:MAG: DinB family protein [Phycisphaerales bacterium]|nr:DinB family protein [Phycisphaerales bacterium]